MTSSDLIIGIIQFAAIIPAIVLHEISHGYVAYLLGDTTAKDRGRLSLNPLKHVDPFGTVLMPILMYAMAGFAFGYAKPVPINPHRFSDYRKGMFFTGIAGPTTNLMLAAVAGVIVRALDLFGGGMGVVSAYAAAYFYYFCLINLVLMFFNLIPIPPLDGSRVLPLFLSDNGMRRYAQAERYGFLILLLVVFIAPRYLGFDPIDGYFRVTVMPLLRLFAGAGA